MPIEKLDPLQIKEPIGAISATIVAAATTENTLGQIFSQVTDKGGCSEPRRDMDLTEAVKKFVHP
jgi:hypothetical protein